MDTKQEQIVTQSQQESQTEILDIQKPEQFKTLPIQIPRESALLTESNESVLLSTEQDTANISNIEIIPEKLTPVQDIVTIIESEAQELKLGKSALKTKAVKVEGSDSKRSIEVYQADVKESTDALKIPVSAYVEAKEQVTKHKEHITVDKPVIHEQVSELTTIVEKSEKASLLFRPLEAQSFEEIIPFTSEEKLLPKKKTTPVQARQEISPMETLEVSQVIESEEAEEYEHQIRLKGVTLQPTLTLSENIEVSEVVSEDRPDKYYPELIVPTEAATETLIEHKSYLTQETTYSEHEEDIVRKIKASEVVANLEVFESLPLEVEQATLAEKEKVMQPKKRPEAFKASEEFGLLESITTSQADIQSPLGDHTITDVERKSAILKVIQQQPISSTTVQIQESVTNLELPGTTTAQGTQEFSTLESSLVTESTVHESAQDLQLDTTAVDQIASVRMSTAQQAASYQQVTSLETTSENVVINMERKEAKVLQVDTYLTSGEQSENIPVEKEQDIRSDARPTSLILTPIIGEHDAILVEQIEVGETEKELSEKQRPSKQKATSKSYLQKTKVALTDEPHIVHTTGVIDDVKVTVEKAQIDYEIKIAHSTAEQTALQGTCLIRSEEIISQTATPQILPQSAMIVTENYPIDSEIPDKKVEPKTSKAIRKSDDHHYKSLLIQEITPHFSVEELEALKTDSFVIDISLSENIAKTVAEDVCLEEEAVFAAETKPMAQTATTDFDIREHLECHKAFLQEKEIHLPDQESPAKQEAKLGETQKLYSPTVHGMQSLESINTLKEYLPLTQIAEQHLDQQESVVSSDVTGFETLSRLEEQSKLPEDHVNIDFVTNKPLEVSMFSSTEKESSFEGEFKPTSYKALYLLDDYQKSIEVAEIKTVDETEEIEHKEVKKESIKHKEVPYQELSVTQSNVWDKESQIKPPPLKEETVAISEEPRNLKVPLIQDVTDSIDLSEMHEEKPKLVKGKLLQDTLNETITSEVTFIDTVSSFDIPEKPAEKPMATIAEGSLAPTKYTQIAIDQSSDFKSEVPSMKNVIAVMTEGNITPLKDMVQTEESTTPFESHVTESQKITKTSFIEGKPVALSTQEVTFDRTLEMVQTVRKESTGQSVTEAYTTTLQEVQTGLESVYTFDKQEIIEDKPKVSLTEIGRIAPLVTVEVKSEREVQLEKEETRVSVAKFSREDANVTSLTEVVFPSLSTGETANLESSSRKAILKQEEITPLLTEEQVSLQEITETFSLDLKTDTASIRVTDRDHLKGVTSEEMLVLESSVESKDLIPREIAKLSQTADKHLVVPIKSIISTVETTRAFESKDKEAYKITEKLEPAHTTIEQSVTFEQFKEGNFEIETPKPKYPKFNTEYHKSINTYEIYPLESETTQANQQNTEPFTANPKEHENIPLITECITPLETFENLDNSIIAVRPRENIEEDTKLQSLQHKVNVLYSGKYITKPILIILKTEIDMAYNFQNPERHKRHSKLTIIS